jgi:hypothetical protein
MIRFKPSIRATTLATALGLALAAPDLASACITPLPMTAAERAARDQAIQEQLWSEAEQVFTARVTHVEAEASSLERGPNGVPMPPSVGSQRIRVALTPMLALKGHEAPPPSFEFRDVYVSCTPGGLESARLDQMFVIYAANPARNTAATALPLAEIRDPVTRAALREANRRR